MTPIEWIALVNAVLPLLTKGITEIQTAANSGTISVEQQQQVADAYAALKKQVENGPFTGPEWQV
ncbi:MAG TPA: hypothetical protein VMQ76_05590 [Terracidiphilus sp.]|nr:hypothetical protein [Terracidiphilus sp.]